MEENRKVVEPLSKEALDLARNPSFSLNLCEFSFCLSVCLFFSMDS